MILLLLMNESCSLTSFDQSVLVLTSNYQLSRYCLQKGKYKIPGVDKFSELSVSFLKLLCCIADNYRPPSEGWGKVIFSVCSHLGGGTLCSGLKSLCRSNRIFLSDLGQVYLPRIPWGLRTI